MEIHFAGADLVVPHHMSDVSILVDILKMWRKPDTVLCFPTVRLFILASQFWNKTWSKMHRQKAVIPVTKCVQVMSLYGMN